MQDFDGIVVMKPESSATCDLQEILQGLMPTTALWCQDRTIHGTIRVDQKSRLVAVEPDTPRYSGILEQEKLRQGQLLEEAAYDSPFVSRKLERLEDLSAELQRTKEVVLHIEDILHIKAYQETP